MNLLRKRSKKTPAISTASLPDIVFLLLFFFMVTAVIRTDDKLVEYQVPKASQLTKAQKKTLIRELHIGRSKTNGLSDAPQVTDGETFLRVEDIVQWANQQRHELPEGYRDQMIIILKADETIKMGLISDIQQELRKANARKVLYRALEKS